jgi:hypothetical protein
LLPALLLAPQVSLADVPSMQVVPVGGASTAITPGSNLTFEAVGVCSPTVTCTTKWAVQCNKPDASDVAADPGGTADNVTITTGPRNSAGQPTATVRVSAGTGDLACNVTVTRTDQYARDASATSYFTVGRGLGARG